MRLHHCLIFFLCFHGEFRNDAFSDEQLPLDGRIATVGWDGPSHEQVTLENYQRFAQAGFTHNISPFNDEEAMQKGLNLAEQCGFKLFLRLPQLAEDPQGIVERFSNHPAAAGYYLMDEPKWPDYKYLGILAKQIKQLDRNLPCFVNLLPNHALQRLSLSYSDYVDECLEVIDPPLLSFDQYPITQKGLKKHWYQNLELIALKARQNKIPFWAFVLSTAHKRYPVPTLAHLRLQAFSNLAYGAQGIEYFTYWTNYGYRGEYHDGPIGKDGKPTPVYELVKKLNQEIIGLSPVFYQATVLQLGHTGPKLPMGTRGYRPVYPVLELRTTGTGTVVALLEKKDRQFLVIVNRDYENSLKLYILFDSSSDIFRVNKNSTLTVWNQEIFSGEVGPGDLELFTWLKKK